MERINQYGSFLKRRFGSKCYKICLDGGFTCPNRDGTLGYGGCTFCSQGGSGDFAESASLSIPDQLRLGRSQTAAKFQGGHYIAYFQAFTNTYGPIDKLRKLYTEAIEPDDIVALSIGTRPDCLPEDVLNLLEEINQVKPVFLEMGLQTCHNHTAELIHRKYPTEIFTQAAKKCTERGIRVSAQVILNLPGESRQDMLETIDYINGLPISGIKLTQLYLLKSSAMAASYQEKAFPLFTQDEYTDCLIACLERLRPDIVVERMTGDAPRDMLLAPLWTVHKRAVLNEIAHKMKIRDTWQGKENFYG